MSVEYYIRIRNRLGIKQEDIGNFLFLNYSKTVNDVGWLNFDIPSNHVALSALEKDGQIEVWRADEAAGIPWYCDFYGFYRTRNRKKPNNTVNSIFTARCVGQMSYLRRPIVAWPAGTANRSQFTGIPGETALKLLVQYNATSDATMANGRIRNAPSWKSCISIEADAGLGSNVTKSYSNKRLLGGLQEIASLGSIDFDLIKTGPRTWEFRTYYPQRGDDLSAEIAFSDSWGNMGEPMLTGGPVEVATVAIVGGKNQGAARDFEVRTSADYVDDYDDIEMFVNASGQDSTELAAAGDTSLNEVRSTDDLSFKILETPAYRYGREYCVDGQMGDLVKGAFEEGTVIKKIQNVTISVRTSSGGQKAEDIQANLVTVPT